MKYIRDIALALIICATLAGITHEVVTMPTSNVSLEEAVRMRGKLAAMEDRAQQAELESIKQNRAHYELVDKLQSCNITKNMLLQAEKRGNP